MFLSGREDAATRKAVRDKLFLRPDIASKWAGRDPLASAFALKGEVFRQVKGRRTLKVRIGDDDFFVKLHEGVGWAEIFKNWLQFKHPVVGADNEFVACRGLQAAGIPAPVPAAYGCGPGNMARRASFILCEALHNFETLEDVGLAWTTHPPNGITRLRLLEAVARFAGQFHHAGFIHRDFYICHLLISRDDLQRVAGPQPLAGVPLAVLDLHRARRFNVVPARWLKRDLAALLFSTLDLGYSVRDWLRFVRVYSGRPLREEMQLNGRLWRSVYKRAMALYKKGLRKGLVTGAFLEI